MKFLCVLLMQQAMNWIYLQTSLFRLMHSVPNIM